MKPVITTKKIKGTTKKPTHIRASCALGSYLVPWNTELDAESNHESAARHLQLNVGDATCDLAGGYSANGGYVFVQIERTKK